MPLTYEPIAEITITSSTASYTFSSITSTFTDLILVSHVFATSISGGYLKLIFNGTTSASYSYSAFGADGTALEFNATTSESQIYASSRGIGLTNTDSPLISQTEIYSYSNNNIFKSVRSHVGRSDQKVVELVAGMFRSTSAISSITASLTNSNIGANSTFCLYGIKAAS